MLGVWLYLWAICSAPLIRKSDSELKPSGIDCWSFVVLSEVCKGYDSRVVLFPQDWFDGSGSFMVPYKFYNHLF